MKIQEVIVRRISRCLGVGVIVLAGVMAWGCGPKSHAEKVAAIRSVFSAEVNSFIVEEEPLVTEVPELEAVEIVETEEGEPVVDDVVVDEMAEIDVIQKVRLDILIRHRSNEGLPGITVDISMVDSSEMEKGSWRVWFDTSNVAKATVTQFTHVLEDVGYEEGDGFFAEVRHPVPAEELGDYREFSEIP